MADTTPNAVNTVLPGGNGNVGGANFTVDPQGLSGISSNSLQPATPMQFSSPNPSPIPSVASLQIAPLTETTGEQKASGLTSQLEGLNTSLVGKSAYQTSQETAAGIPQLSDQQRDLSTQVSQLKNEALAIPQQLQNDASGRGMTVGGLGAIQSAALRNNSVQALSVSSLLDATNGLLASAQDKANKAVAAKYDPIQEQITAATNNLNLILKDPQTTLDDKNRAQAQLDQQNAKQAQLNGAIQNMKDVNAIALEAAKNGADATTLNKITQSTDQASAIAAAGGSLNANTAALMAKYPDANILPGDSPITANQKIQNSPSYTIAQKSAALDVTYKQAEIAKMNADAAAAAASDATVNPDVLQGMMNVYKSTGVLPAFGLSAKSPLRAQFYAALGSPDGAQIVSDANTNKSVRAGLATAYRTQQNLLSANETAINTLDQQLTLAKQYSDQVSRTNSPLVSKYVVGLKTGVFGDPQAAAFNNIVKTASYEFAKILSGSAASVSGVTISSAADAEQMLNTAMSKGQFNEVIGLMQKEAQFRLQSQKDTLTGLQTDMGNVGSLTNSLQNASNSYNGVTLPGTNGGSTYNGITLPN